MHPAVILDVLDSRYQAAAHCLVCGSHIPAGEGFAARYAGRSLRFKCAGCLRRFRADPERFLAGHGSGCCDEVKAQSPVSEWCD